MPIDLIFTVGLLILAALLAGEVVVLVRLPKVTAYLLVGVLLGRSGLDFVSPEPIEQIDPLAKLAIALVVVNNLVAIVAFELVFLAIGVHGRQILAELDRLTGLLCVVFFVVGR